MRPYYYLGDDRALTQLSGGEPFYVYTRDRSITPWIVLGGIWETFVDDILCSLVRPGDTFLDVGANQGYYTVKIGVRVGPTGRIFSFEPNPTMFRFVHENAEINALLGRATLVPAAVGAEPGRAVMDAPANYPGGGHVLLADPGVRNEATVEVDVVRIDDIVPADVHADLIKIDVEGFEPLALHGMRALLERSPDCPIVCEVNMAAWARFGDPVQLLRTYSGDRRLFRIQHDGVLDEMTEDAVGDLDPNFVSYVLMLPDTPHRYEQIRRFVRSERISAALAALGRA